MTGHTPSARVRCGVVLGVQEDARRIVGHGRLSSVRYATRFPSPRVERVSPGHLVAVATAPDGTEVVARRRDAQQRRRPGTRAYPSAGLPGADWWVAGPADARAEDADVELDEVERFCTEHHLWDRLA